jgi:hypothetical protein
MRVRLMTVLLAFVVVASVLYLRWRPRPAGDIVESEKEIVFSPPTPSPPPVPAPQPELSEVQPTLDRVFKHTLTMDRATRPAFVAGDFNGDDTTDLAVAVHPRSEDALAELNAELASWGVQDATAPPPIDEVEKPAPVKVAGSDLLLAVIHGVGEAGWRSPDSQGYLVKNAVGSGMRTRPLASVPLDARMNVIRSHTGDVIAADWAGEPGLIVFTGATHVWTGLRPRGPARSPVPPEPSKRPSFHGRPGETEPTRP